MSGHLIFRPSTTAGRACAAGFVFLATAFPLGAQVSVPPRNHLYDRLELGVAASFVLDRSEARVDSPEGEVGTTFSLTSALGMPSATVQPVVGLRWKPTRRAELELSYQFLNQSGQRTITQNLEIGGDSVYAGLRSTSDLGSDDATLQLKYALWAGDAHTVGLALGVGAIFFRLQVDAEGDASGGGGSVVDTVRIDKRFTGPTASIGAFGNVRLGPRWYVGADVRAFAVQFDRYSATVAEGNLLARYYLSDHWGVATSLYYTDATIEVMPPETRSGDASDLFGSVKHAYTSLRLGVIGAF